jgi:hypothetical protein
MAFLPTKDCCRDARAAADLAVYMRADAEWPPWLFDRNHQAFVGMYTFCGSVAANAWLASQDVNTSPKGRFPEDTYQAIFTPLIIGILKGPRLPSPLVRGQMRRLGQMPAAKVQQKGPNMLHALCPVEQEFEPHAWPKGLSSRNLGGCAPPAVDEPVERRHKGSVDICMRGNLSKF